MFQGTGFGSSTSSPFGSSTYKPATSVFNTGPMFGSTGSSSLFGSNTTQPSTGLFGSTTTPAFGQTQQPQNTFGGFTATSNAGTGLFGNQQNANTGSLFGASTTPFGQNKPAFGGFGTTNQSTGLFGQQTTPTQPNQAIFGQPQAQQSTGLFGASTAFGGGGAGGTTIKFTPVTGTDTMVKNGVSTQISTRHHCITCMKEYESKSLEELRLEDYVANRKGPQQGGQTAGGLFGAPAQQSSLFGTQSSTPSTGLFGTTTDNKSVFGSTSTSFGASNTNLFGGNVGMFNKPAGAATPFGTPPTSSTATTNFGFNTNTSNNLFGQTTQPGFFSNTSQASSGFGTQTSGFTPFGQNQQQGGLFGQNKPTFSLGATTNPGFSFGSTATTSSTLTPSFTANKTTPFSTFGTPASTSAGFGQSPFGQAPNQSSSFFSSNSFNKPVSSGFSFGATTTTNTLGTGLNFNAGNSLFGQNQNKPGGLFNTGSSNLFNMNNTFSGGTFNTGTSGLNSSTFSLGSNPAGNSLLPSFGQNAATPQSNALNQYMLVLASMPFGDSPLFKNLVPSTSKSDESIKPTSPAAMKSLQSGINHKVLPSSRSKVKIVKPNSMTRNSLFDGLDEDEEELNGSLSSLDSSGIKNHRLNVRSLQLKNRQFNLDTSVNQSYNETNNNSNDTGYNNMTSPQPQDQSFTRLIKKNIVFQPDQMNDSDINRASDRIVVSPLAKLSDSSMNNSKMLEMSNVSLDSSVIEDPLRRRADVNLKRLELSKMNISNVNNQSDNKDPPEQSTSTSSSGESEAEECGGQSEEPHPTGIILTRAGYYTIPSLSDLTQLMDSEGRCIVDNFTIGRLNYGNVFYPESFDVSNLNLDKIVHFRHKEVVIYPDDEDKPPVGSGINRRAQVTLDCVWPVDKQTRQPISDPLRLQAIDFEEKLRRASAKHGTRFIEYRPQTGSWVFKVDHFSKYALTDSDEEDGGGTSVKQTKFTPAVMPGKEQLTPLQQQDAAASSAALRAAQKYRARKSVIDDQMEVQLDPLSVHLFLEDEDEEMADGPFDLYEMDSILSPTSKLSRQLGTSAHKLQLMKASFFEQDLPMDDHLEGGEAVFQPSSIPTPLRLSKVTFGEPMNTSDLSLPLRPRMDEVPKTDYNKQLLLTNDDKIDESEEEYIIDNEAASSRPVLYQVDYGTSWLEHSQSTILKSGQESYLADEMFARGLSFKASWGPSGILTTVETDSPFFVDTLSLTSISQQQFKESIVDQLDGALKCSVINTESGVPLALCPDGVVALTKHLNIARRQSSSPEMFLNAFALCHALWGQLPATDAEDTNYNISLARKHAVSSWLETVTVPLAKADVDKSGDSPASVFAWMTCRSVVEACKLAMSIGDKRLSLVLSQAGSSKVVRGLVDRQLTEWRETQADRHIDPDRILLYMLSAGRITHQTSESLFTACHSLDWIRAFALHMWYACWTTSSVSEALSEYDKSWSGKEKFAPSPLPPHIDDAYDSDTPLSVLYHLLKLFSDRSHPLNLLLNPDTHTSDALDYRLSWMLMRVLMSLGYSHLSEYNTCLIHTSFASQLELYGLWHWAIFVLLHIDSDQREKLICDTIERHIVHEKDELKEEFLKEKLKIPIGWIASAKATRALVNKNYEEAARNLLLADEWNHAHDVIMKHIASAAMVNDKYSLMEELLSELEKEERYREILSWNTGGLVLLEYLRGVALIESLRQNGQIDEVLNDLMNMAQRIYSRIKLLPNNLPIDRLCQTELSERLVKLLPEAPLDLTFEFNSQITDETNQWQPWDMESLNTSLS